MKLDLFRDMDPQDRRFMEDSLMEGSNTSVAGYIQGRNYLREKYGEKVLAEYDRRLAETHPDMAEAMKAEDATKGFAQADFGAAGRANLLLGDNVLEAEKTEAQIEALGMEDYTYDPTNEEGAGYQLPDRIEHAGEVDPLKLQMQQDAINQERTDTTGVDAQKGVLGEYANLYGQGGLSAIDRARMARARQMRATQAKGDRGAILQRMEQMGRSGGNAELLAQLDAQGQAEQALAMDDLQTESMALQRRDSILRDAGSLGGSIQSAQDAIDQFNALGERDRAKQNIDRENFALTSTWNEGNERDKTFTETKNEAHGVQFAEDSARSKRIADRSTEASRFNVSPNQGRRGQIGDIERAKQITAGARESVATNLTGDEARKDAKSAARTAAIVGLAGTGGEIATNIYGAADGDDDEEGDK